MYKVKHTATQETIAQFDIKTFPHAYEAASTLVALLGGEYHIEMLTNPLTLDNLKDYVKQRIQTRTNMAQTAESNDDSMASFYRGCCSELRVILSALQAGIKI